MVSVHEAQVRILEGRPHMERRRAQQASFAEADKKAGTRKDFNTIIIEAI